MKHHCTHLYLSYTTDVKNRMSMKSFLMIAINPAPYFLIVIFFTLLQVDQRFLPDTVL